LIVLITGVPGKYSILFWLALRILSQSTLDTALLS
jgi:hypothetical protein